MYLINQFISLRNINSRLISVFNANNAVLWVRAKNLITSKDDQIAWPRVLKIGGLVYQKT